MAGYYFIWISAFLLINVVWDWRSAYTANFHLEKLKDKGDVIHNAVTFCSSLLILTGLISAQVQELGRDTMIPLFLAGFSGLIRSLPALCPYKASDVRPNVGVR
jgi:hypothetical protein